MSGIESDVQQLSPGPILEFWELNATSIGGGIVRFQGQQDGKVWWQGQEYDAWPVQGEGFERTSDQQPTPKFRVGNVDRSITILCQALDDLVGATLTRRRTFAKYLDSVNFPEGPVLTPGGGNFDSPNQLSQWTITAGNVSAPGDGKLYIGKPGGASAVYFTFVSEVGVNYDLSMFVVDNAGTTPGAFVRVGTALDNWGLGVLALPPGTGGSIQFVGTGQVLYVQVVRGGTSNQAQIDFVHLRVAGGNPTADPTKEFAPELWFIERKSAESFEAVEFELSSALDFNGVKLPRRQIIANQCPFAYRGPLCNYTGPPVADELDQPTDNPSLDKCGRRLASCKLRLWPDDTLNFGGFPAAGLVRT